MIGDYLIAALTPINNIPSYPLMFMLNHEKKMNMNRYKRRKFECVRLI